MSYEDQDEWHYTKCPAHEDALPVFTECKGVGRCECYDDKLWGTRWLHRLLNERWRGFEECREEPYPECECEDIEQREAADRGDAANDAARCW